MTRIEGKSHRIPNMRIDLLRRERENPWSGTDPRHHYPQSFLYLVHAVKLPEMSHIHFALAEMSSKTNGKIKYNDIYAFDLLREPQKIPEKPIISASLIDHDHTGTWSGGGFILEVSPEHVLAAAPQDLGTDFFDPEGCRDSLLKSSPLAFKPDELLKATAPYNYNEVVLAGKTKDGLPVKIKGIFIIKTTGGNLLDPILTGRLLWLAHSNNWPVIYITHKELPFEETVRLEEVSINREEGQIYFSADGKRFDFRLKVKCFWIMENGGKTIRPINRDEVLSAIVKLKELLENGDRNSDIYQFIDGVIRQVEALPVYYFIPGFVFFPDTQSIKDVSMYGKDDLVFAFNERRYIFNPEGSEFSVIVPYPGHAPAKLHKMSPDEFRTALNKLRELLSNADPNDPRCHMVKERIEKIETYWESFHSR